jgi:hypothetical protein
MTQATGRLFAAQLTILERLELREYGFCGTHDINVYSGSVRATSDRPAGVRPFMSAYALKGRAALTFKAAALLLWPDI